MEHRWSGWPGAYCQDCGAEDQREICLADCGGTSVLCSCGTYLCTLVTSLSHTLTKCAIHQNVPCLVGGNSDVS